ncbi:hypothetical protein CHS0354_041846 [Potamilus streckersoni]|uniref:TIR domain-containing protein n=1 Tax=Potamilus streckersoni TaxID=2493646 RepID=A0AAE0T1Z4_9BIVA|nr:hypothetical protein CHS0354_041846 [Potamilus streckersoni]
MARKLVLLLCVILVCISCIFRVGSEQYCDCRRTGQTLYMHCTVPRQKEIFQCIGNNTDANNVYFTDSQLTTIPSALTMLSNVSYLNLERNNIEELDDFVFSYIGKTLETIVLDHNNINILRNGTLNALVKLKDLFIRCNAIEVIEPDVINSNLKSLINIQWSFNRLREVDLGIAFILVLSNNQNLVVNVSHNNISNVTNYYQYPISIFNLNDSIYVDLRRNNFTTVDVAYLLRILQVKSLQDLYRLGNCGFNINYNPLLCDCNLFPFAFYIKEFHSMDPDNPVFAITCDSPESLRGMRIFDVPMNEFNCSVEKDCPATCTCQFTVVCNLLTITCADDRLDALPSLIPEGKTIHMVIHSRNLRTLSDRSYLSNVSILDVTSSAVSTVDNNFLHYLDTVEKMFLNDNSLEILPNDIQYLNLTHLESLTIHNNPYICDCHTLWMKHWLLKNRIKILELEKIKCATGSGIGKAIIEVDDNLFICQSDYKTPLLISFGSLVLLVIVVCVLIKNKEHMQVCLIAHFKCCNCLRSKFTTELENDVFIAFSKFDNDYVIGTLFPFFKKKEIKYISYHDFMPGEVLLESIEESIRSSITTLAVLTNNFLESKWCLQEFYQAHQRFICDRNRKLMILVVEDRLDQSRLRDEKIQIYMKTNIYIATSNVNYLYKLLSALPRVARKNTSAESEDVPIHGHHFGDNSSTLERISDSFDSNVTGSEICGERTPLL